ncbi:SPOR domain-containing protein [Vibrio parahaemolyticus]|uniref:SPOR domain-containing protein n=1 Tax=Vibrio mediterranei TaxID=689 RepID=UPI004069855A
MWRYVSALLMIVTGFVAQFVHAEPSTYVCDSAYKSSHAVPILESECPIGDGLWGNQQPKSPAESYWIQCGFVKSGSLRSIPNRLQQLTNKSVWLKPEMEGDRCLIGPYEEFSAAQQDLAKIKSIPSYSDAFIRSLAQRITTSKTQLIAGKSTSRASQTSQPVHFTVIAATPYMIAGKHSRQDCQCYF